MNTKLPNLPMKGTDYGIPADAYVPVLVKHFVIEGMLDITIYDGHVSDIYRIVNSIWKDLGREMITMNSTTYLINGEYKGSTSDDHSYKTIRIVQLPSSVSVADPKNSFIINYEPVNFKVGDLISYDKEWVLEMLKGISDYDSKRRVKFLSRGGWLNTDKIDQINSSGAYLISLGEYVLLDVLGEGCKVVKSEVTHHRMSDIYKDCTEGESHLIDHVLLKAAGR